jgi:hypothetical protein
MAQAVLALVVYLVGCLVKDDILKTAAAKKLVGALEDPDLKPAREAVARKSVGSLVDTIISNNAAEADPDDKKKPESKGKRILRGINIAAGLYGLLKK